MPMTKNMGGGGGLKGWGKGGDFEGRLVIFGIWRSLEEGRQEGEEGRGENDTTFLEKGKGEEGGREPRKDRETLEGFDASESGGAERLERVRGGGWVRPNGLQLGLLLLLRHHGRLGVPSAQL